MRISRKPTRNKAVGRERANNGATKPGRTSQHRTPAREPEAEPAKRLSSVGRSNPSTSQGLGYRSSIAEDKKTGVYFGGYSRVTWPWLATSTHWTARAQKSAKLKRCFEVQVQRLPAGRINHHDSHIRTLVDQKPFSQESTKKAAIAKADNEVTNPH